MGSPPVKPAAAPRISSSRAISAASAAWPSPARASRRGPDGPGFRAALRPRAARGSRSATIAPPATTTIFSARAFHQQVGAHAHEIGALFRRIPGRPPAHRELLPSREAASRTARRPGKQRASLVVAGTPAAKKGPVRAGGHELRDALPLRTGAVSTARRRSRPEAASRAAARGEVAAAPTASTGAPRPALRPQAPPPPPSRADPPHGATEQLRERPRPGGQRAAAAGARLPPRGCRAAGVRPREGCDSEQPDAGVCGFG